MCNLVDSGGTMTKYPGSKSKSKSGSVSTGRGTKEGAAPSKRSIVTRASTGRAVFLFCLAAMAGAFGYLVHYLLTQGETVLATEQFEAIADRALDTALEIASRQRLGLVTLASVAEQAFPNATTWPFVDFKGFEVVSNNIILTSSGPGGQDLGFLPIVTPEELDDFNSFGASLYPDAPFDRVTGLDETFTRYNETDGTTYWDSPYRIFTPFLFHSRGPILHLANLRSIQSRGVVMDDMIRCSEERTRQLESGEFNASTAYDCSVVSDISDLSNRNPIEQPAAVVFHPMYPENDPTTLVGFLTSAIKWSDALVNIFSDGVSGVDCVFETDTQAFTYRIHDGQAILEGEGNLHDPRFASYAKKITLIEKSRVQYSNYSVPYTLTVYPTDEFFDIYTTDNPIVATIGAVAIVLFTSFIFITFDWCVRRDFHDKDAEFQAKKAFVRFISHEVRTPLNSVCMGLQLLKEDALRLLKGYEDSKAVKTSMTMVPSSSMIRPEEGKHGERPENHSGFISSGVSLTTQTEQAGTSTDIVENKLTDIVDVSSDILVNAHSAVDVLNDLLNYDKVESGTLSLELSIIPIWDLIEKTVAEFRTQADCSKIDYSLDFSPLLESSTKSQGIISSVSQLPRDVKNRKIVGDNARITQVLRNLISNALKFSPQNGKLTIRTRWNRHVSSKVMKKSPEFTLHSGEVCSFPQTGELFVEVKDTGAGMTGEQLNNLFHEGVQFNVNELQAGQGSGLGLFIAKGILDQHGGSLSADSEGLNCGTTFTMKIPLYCVPDPESGDLEGSGEEAKGDDDLPVTPLTVLVVDDSAMNRKMLIRLLKNQNHSCDEANDGLDAVSRVRDGVSKGTRYDAILMDYEMPVMNGPEAVKKIRAMGCDSFVAGVTGNLFPEDIAYFKECGANIVLGKPFDLQELVNSWVEFGVV